MKILSIIALIFFCVISPARAAPSVAIAKAQHAALVWLELLDSGKYGESWDAASHLWKGDHSRQKTVRILKELREPHGAIKSRVVISAEVLKVPKGDCVHIEFRSSFSNLASSVETVDLQPEANGEWKVTFWGQR